jgi:hypothetical protein
MDLNKMYCLVAVFGSTVVREVLELTKISNPTVVTEVFNDMNMSRHAECAEYLFS